ncbi:hypothetical protein D9613_000637 [Agrocybe pediades]|uniref:UV excision repair protein RAD23 n=1 Tax=Agrocybe pediades TaxID=84607 RepID=A0A8H4VRP0_9AGAR|nr:hypothetical protein D9613_000637 [Agrocybe pediades]KAF9566827.1 UV excision repair protein Rad23 [Agrocybe pediades]
MKITIKTTQQKVFHVDVDPADSIASLKSKIEQSQGHSVASQKIIYSGKILTDDKTVDSCGIKEKDFLVLMVSKPKPTPAPAASSSAPSTVPAPAPATPLPAPPVAAEAPVASSLSSTPQESAAPQTRSAPSSAPAPAFGDPSVLLSGTGLQDAINNMVEMGFPKDQVLRAMRASFNNADRAVEYLMNGIPAHLEAESGRQQSAEATPPVQNQATPAPAAPVSSSQPQAQPQNLFQLAQQQQSGGGNPGAAGGAQAPPGLNLDALRDNPQIQQLRQQMITNPELIQPLIQQLAAQNPAIAQMLAQNPEALLQLLGIELADMDEGEDSLPPGAHVVSVTEEERAAIQRLEGLGFSRQAAVEAYFACDKNEELAANYLFESNFED